VGAGVEVGIMAPLPGSSGEPESGEGGEEHGKEASPRASHTPSLGHPLGNAENNSGGLLLSDPLICPGALSME
jgi:hypothetical protein